MCPASATGSIRSIRARRGFCRSCATPAKAGTVAGRFADIAEAVEAEVAGRKGKRIPLNIDGATAVIYGELGFPPPLDARPLRAVALRRHSRACLGAVAGARSKQGPAAARMAVGLYGAAGAFAGDAPGEQPRD